MADFLVRFVCGRDKPFVATLERIRDFYSADEVCQDDGETTWEEFLECEYKSEFYTDNYIIEKL